MKSSLLGGCRDGGLSSMNRSDSMASAFRPLTAGCCRSQQAAPPAAFDPDWSSTIETSQPRSSRLTLKVSGPARPPRIAKAYQASCAANLAHPVSDRRAKNAHTSRSGLPSPITPCLPRHPWSLPGNPGYILYSWTPRLLSSGYAVGFAQEIHVETSTCVLFCAREISQRAKERSNA